MFAALDVLIVDDHEAMRALLSAVLERAGATSVRAAKSGAEALEKIAARAPALLLVDQNMPDMSGVALIERVRAEPRLAAMKIVMITGAASDDQADRAHAAGADAMLVKPVSPRALIATLERVLSG